MLCVRDKRPPLLIRNFRKILEIRPILIEQLDFFKREKAVIQSDSREPPNFLRIFMHFRAQCKTSSEVLI